MVRNSIALILTALLALLPSVTFAAGVGRVGVSAAANTTPDYILIIGDPQIGGQCWSAVWTRWSNSIHDTAHQDCGQRQIVETKWTIDYAEANYDIGAIVMVGDLVQDGGTSGAWQMTALQTMVSALPADIRAKLYHVSGNHDADGTNCSKLDDYFSYKFDTAGEVSPLSWSVRLNQTRLVGLQGPIVALETATPCHAQNDSAKYTAGSGGYPAAVCFGDDSGGGGFANGVGCANDGECSSGQCGIWEDLYTDQMDFLESEFDEFNSSWRDKTIVVNNHQALCRDVSGTSNCQNTPSVDSFFKIQDQYQCDGGSDDGKYCEPVFPVHGCADAAPCTAARVGDFGTRTRINGMISKLFSRKQGIAWASGHVGTSSQEPTTSTAQFPNGIDFLKAEVVGPFAVGWLPTKQWGAVIKVTYDGPPTIVEYVRGDNNAPVITEPGAISIPTGTGSYRFTATDVDYGNLDYYLPSTTENDAMDGCLVLDPMGTLNAQDIVADLDATSCSGPATYPPSGAFTICVTDGLLSGGAPTGDGLEDCASFTVDVSAASGSSLWDTMVWDTDVWG